MKRPPRYLVCTHLFQPGGWMSPGALELNEAGFIVNISGVMPRPGEDILRLDGYALPGMPAVHSRAVWRAVAGLGRSEEEAEAALSLLSPEELEAVAAQLYVELIEAGFTSVGEFRGEGLADPAAEAAAEAALLSAAAHTQIGLTLLRAAAQASKAPPEGGARLRFGLADRPSEGLAERVAALREADEDAVVHLDLSEGAAPAVELDSGFCLVGGAPSEARAAIDAGAVLGLCPAEAAIRREPAPPAAFFEGGRVAIGTGRHLSVDLAGALRALFCVHDGVDYGALSRDGAFALGQPAGVLAPGFSADLIVLDPHHPRLVGLPPARVMDAFVLGGGAAMIDQVLVGGLRIVEGGRHVERRAVFQRFSAALGRWLRRLA